MKMIRKMMMMVVTSVAATIFVSCAGGAGQQSSAEGAAQEEKTTFSVDDFDPVYDDDADPAEQIREAVRIAGESDRHVICQVGGNWCKWCLLFADFLSKDEELTKVVEDNFVFVHINVQKENPKTGKMERCREAMDMLGNPVRFGFPVFVVLDAEGNVLHIQDSSFLEEGIGYDKKKVLRFLDNWTPEALVK